MISDKYICGLIDSDGSIKVIAKEGQRPTMSITISQKLEHSKVLHMIAEYLGGTVSTETIGNGQYCSLRIPSKIAKVFLLRSVKHLVIKRHYAEWIISQLETIVTDVKEFENQKAINRAQQYLPLPNYPTRKWLAGYFDGDGYVGVNSIRKDNTVVLQAEIVCHSKDYSGIQIIQKNFGGKIINQKSKPNILRWYMTFDPLNNTNFLDYFFKHSVIKQDQILAIKKYIEHKDGVALKEELKSLKRLALTK